MSKKIKEQINDKSQTHVLTVPELNFMNSLTNVQQSTAYWIEELKNSYMKMVSIRLGYKPEDNLKFEIDLADPKRELVVTIVPADQLPSDPQG